MLIYYLPTSSVLLGSSPNFINLDSNKLLPSQHAHSAAVNSPSSLCEAISITAS